MLPGAQRVAPEGLLSRRCVLHALWRTHTDQACMFWVCLLIEQAMPSRGAPILYPPLLARYFTYPIIPAFAARAALLPAGLPQPGLRTSSR
jgi:hypothetical protein